MLSPNRPPLSAAMTPPHRLRTAAQLLGFVAAVVALVALPLVAVLSASPSLSPVTRQALLASAQESVPTAEPTLTDFDAPVAFIVE